MVLCDSCDSPVLKILALFILCASSFFNIAFLFQFSIKIFLLCCFVQRGDTRILGWSDFTAINGFLFSFCILLF